MHEGKEKTREMAMVTEEYLQSAIDSMKRAALALDASRTNLEWDWSGRKRALKERGATPEQLERFDAAYKAAVKEREEKKIPWNRYTGD